MASISRKHQATVENIRRCNPGIAWSDVEALLAALGAERHERTGSRVVFVLGGTLIRVHRVHGRRECGYRLLSRLRSFLLVAGVL